MEKKSSLIHYSSFSSFIAIFFVVATFFIGGYTAYATADIIDNFDSYSVGSDVYGQGDWTKQSTPYNATQFLIATTSSAFSGDNVLMRRDGSVENPTPQACNAFSAFGTVDVDISFMLSPSAYENSPRGYSFSVDNGAGSAYRELFYLGSLQNLTLGGYDLIVSSSSSITTGNTLYSINYTSLPAWKTFRVVISNGDEMDLYVNGQIVYSKILSSDYAMKRFCFTTSYYSDVPEFYFDSFGVETSLGSSYIVSLSPENADVLPSGVGVDYELQYYIDEADFGFWGGYNVNVILHNIDQNVLLLSALSPSDIVLLDEDVSVGGYYTFNADDIVIPDGNYRIQAKLRNGLFDLRTIDELSHQFIVGSSTFVGSISQNTYSVINGIYASSTATSTESLAEACGLFSSSSSVVNCLGFLFIPDGNLINQSLTDFRDLASTHFPLGYITDFISILSNSSSSVALPTISATIPEGIAGSGASIALSLDSLSWIFNATSTFTTGDLAGKSLYEIVSPYWEKFIYIALGFYLLNRILGSGVIGRVVSKASSYNRKL